MGNKRKPPKLKLKRQPKHGIVPSVGYTPHGYKLVREVIPMKFLPDFDQVWGKTGGSDGTKVIS